VIAGPLPPTLAERLASGGQAPRGAGPDTAAGRQLAIWANARTAREHGVTQALGTDATFGQFDDHHDLAWRAQGLAELAGWPEPHVLEAIWPGGAAALGAPGMLGTIAPGAHADLVVPGADPRHDIRALHDVRAVYRAGRRTA
jgi:imidazolonepropionase-like amidohydrolase